MKLAVALVLGLVALALSTPVEQETKNFKVADKEFLKKQHDVNMLFYQIQQTSYYKDFVKIADEFDIHKSAEYYTDKDAYHNFVEYYKYHKFLPKGAVFSIFNSEHTDQVQVLFKLFYYAKDYDTFYKTAVWVRQNFNEAFFLYTYSVALVHRPDTYGIILPPIYEIYPHYFYSSEVIQQLQYYKQIYQGDKKDKYVVYANYSGDYLNLHPEQSMSYFMEDVGVNAFYYYYNVYYPTWMCGKEFNLVNEKRGELFYYVHQQILARFYLERISNGFGEIPFFNWDVPFETPYYPSLQYPNGLEFPARPKFAKLHEYFYNYGQKWTFKTRYGYSYTHVKEYERRIRDATDAGIVFDKKGQYFYLFEEKDKYYTDAFNKFGGLVANYHPESPLNSFFGDYQTFGRHLLGYSYQAFDYTKLAPSALEHFETSLRDPAFYQFYKKVVLFFQRFKSHLPPYTESDLTFPGVKVEKVTFDRLITFFDSFDAEVNNGVYVTEKEFNTYPFRAVVRQQRLNHKPFTYSIKVSSEKEAKATIKIYLGPKYDEYDRFINLTENRINFVEFDNFVFDLKAGVNEIKRNSYDSVFYKDDRTSYYNLYHQVEEALKSGTEFKVDGSQNYFNFPRRFLLPMGSYSGTPFQFYVFVAPYIPYENQKPMGEYFYPKMGSAAQYLDGYPLSYPFDRMIKFEEMFYNLPNAYFYETKVFHRNVGDVQNVQ